jgi:hypothetical protein
MTFGQPTDFAIEAYHEPYGPEYGGFGRMCIHIQGVQLGDIRENHCSLFHAADRCRELCPSIETLWDDSFAGLSDSEIYAAVEHDYRVADNSDWERFGRFYFLTFAGEPFDGYNIMAVCRPDRRVQIIYSLPDDTFGSAFCSIESFRHAADSFVLWFDEQVRTVAPPFFPINPFDPNETVPKTRDA